MILKIIAVLAISTPLYAAPKIIANVDGEEITQAAVENFMQHIKKTVSFKDALSEMVTIELLVAKRLQSPIEIDSPLELELARTKKALIASDQLSQILSTYKPSEVEITKAYREIYLNSKVGTEYNASHILVEQKAQAENIIQQLTSGQDFSVLAKEHSTGPSGANGGALGWFGLAKMVKPFSDATAQLEKGAFSMQPVQTQFGWHIIKLNDLKTSEAPKLEAVRKEIHSRLSAIHLTQEIKKLQKTASIKAGAAQK